jgi:adenylate cyclase
MSGPTRPNGAPLSKADLAAQAGVGEGEIDRLVEARVVVPRDEDPPFRASDVLRVRVGRACEAGGLPMEGMAKAIAEGRLSFAFVESWPFEAAAAPTSQTHADLAEEIGLPFDVLRAVLEAFGFAGVEVDEPAAEAERPIAALMGRAVGLGVLDEAGAVRLASVYAEVFRRAAAAETEVYHSGIEMPLFASGLDQRRAMEAASATSEELLPLLDATVLAAYRRQQELAWTEHQIEHVEQALESIGISLPPGPPPAMSFVDLSGFTRLTEERGDAEAASLAARLADIVRDSPSRHRGEAVKWVGDGVMMRFRDPTGAVLSGLDIVREAPTAGLPPAHVGVAAGPVIRQGGDYYGRTVNLASRISNRAAAGQVLVSAPVVESTSIPDVGFVSVGHVALEGMPRPIELFEARRR